MVKSKYNKNKSVLKGLKVNEILIDRNVLNEIITKLIMPVN
jgi:hypothetical protein